MALTRLFLHVLLCCGAGVLGGLMFGIYHCIAEHLWYFTFLSLERKKIIRKLAPSIPPTVNKYRKEDFWAGAIANMPLAALFVAGRHTFLQSFELRLNAVEIFGFTWIMMVLHDAYFWAVHTLMHKYKTLYRKIHQLHHTTGGEITVFWTAAGHEFDIFFLVTPYYALMMVCWIYVVPTWNPLWFIFASWALNNVNIIGHSGYKLPAWIYGPASLGILLTPFAHTPIHHYIHHLDPRYNRAPYFSWWDRAAGTFKDHHLKLLNDCKSIYMLSKYSQA